MPLKDRLKPYLKHIKVASIISGTTLFISYHVHRTYMSLSKIVNTDVMDREKRTTPSYIYIEDPVYTRIVKKERERENQQVIGFARIWKSIKDSIAWKLLWICKHGNIDQKNIALSHLASFRNNKDWDCLQIAQAMDKNTAVLLARTEGADIRYFLPPPLHIRRAALEPELLSYKLKDLILAVHNINPHSCIQNFLAKNFINIQEQIMESDIILAKPNVFSEEELCILCFDALFHHLSMFYNKDYDKDISCITLVNLGILQCISEAFLRFHNSVALQISALRILQVLSIHVNLLTNFFQNGLIRELTKMLHSDDIYLASSSAVCLANLSGEYLYKPGIYLLHPIYRTRKPFKCDTLLVHGLRGGVFVTWRQRDLHYAKTDVSNFDKKLQSIYQSADPELKRLMEDAIEMEEESLLFDYDIVLHDLPLNSVRESETSNYCADNKRKALIREIEDCSTQTQCWPRDWLPKDCDNLRILGVNYWTSLSEWLERCPQQYKDIDTRSLELAQALKDAGVGMNKPIVWLAHSMGGLLVKQVLINSFMSNSDTSKLCDKTKAVLFFSTPHLGSHIASMHRAAAAILWPSKDVRQLELNSPFLLEMYNRFNNIAHKYNWETISFAEAKPTLVTAFNLPIRLVESGSADPGIGVFYELPLDHLCICKPATRQSILYTTVLNILNRVTSEQENYKGYSNLLNLLDAVLTIIKNSAERFLETMEDTVDNPDM